MTKQEKIIHAYGQHWNTVKEFTNDFGWCNFKELFGDMGNNKGLEGIQLEVSNPYNPKYCYFKRPICLSGIENNNGWTKLDDESDLPKELGRYNTVRANGIRNIEYFYKNEHSWYLWKTCYGITHYRIIEVHDPPVY